MRLLPWRAGHGLLRWSTGHFHVGCMSIRCQARIEIQHTREVSRLGGDSRYRLGPNRGENISVGSIPSAVCPRLSSVLSRLTLSCRVSILNSDLVLYAHECSVYVTLVTLCASKSTSQRDRALSCSPAWFSGALLGLRARDVSRVSSRPIHLSLQHILAAVASAPRTSTITGHPLVHICDAGEGVVVRRLDG